MASTPPGFTAFTLTPTVGRALDQLARAQGLDGWWRTPYLGGPLHTGAGLVATNLLAAPSAGRSALEWELLEGMLATQGPDGSVPSYAGGPCTRPAARLTELVCRLVVRQSGDSLSADRRDRALAAADRARRFAEHAPHGGAFSELVINLVGNAISPDEPDVPGAALGAEAASLLFTAPGSFVAEHALSSFARQALPAIAVLVDVYANRSLAERVGARLLQLAGCNPDREAKRVLEERIVASQSKTGGWLWSVFGTALNLLALRALGRDASDERVRRGVAFIDGLRIAAGGGSKQSWCNAEIWDTSVAGSALLFAGIEPPKLEAVVDAVLAEQQTDGLWAFGIGALAGDNDSSAMALSFLARAAKRLPPAARERTQEAGLRCAEALLANQETDGGFGYSPAPYEEPYGFGRRVPFGIETALVDASTADVTGRVMAATLAASTAFGSAAFASQARAALERTAAYLQSSQSAVGSWPGRWTSGYLSSLAFALPPLRVFAPGLAPYGVLPRARRFVLAHRNGDGGWGETTLADSRPDEAGEGTSTAVQTAYATIALAVTAAPGDDDTARDLGAAFLEAGAADGTWHNDRALYTVAFREDYFDAPFMTDAMVTTSLLYVSAVRDLGVDRATALFVLG